MNPHLRRPDLTPPRTRADLFTVPPAGRRIRLKIGRDWLLCHVTKAEGREFRARILTLPPKGKRWNLRLVPLGARVMWGVVPYMVVGRTGVALRLRKADS